MPKNRERGRDGIYMRNGHYCISFIDAQGRRRQRKTNAHTLQQARAIRAQMLQEAEKQRILGYAPPSRDTFAEFVPRYLRHQKARITPRPTSVPVASSKSICGPPSVRRAWRRFDGETFSVTSRSAAQPWQRVRSPRN